MKSNGWLLGGALVLCFTVGAKAQEDPAVPTEDGAEPGTAETAIEPAPEAESSWWKETFGDKNALYLEVGFAGGAFEEIDPSVQTDPNFVSRATLEIESIFGGRAVVGWKLPFDRGRYVLAFEGFEEDSYEFEAAGLFNQVLGPFGVETTTTLYPWWSVRSSDSGRVDGVRNPPIWTDADQDNNLDPGEVAAGAADLLFSSPTTDTLKNTTQTWDLLYQREWGGRRFRGAWSAGVRAFLYEGTVPMAAWLGLDALLPGTQYTDGTVIRLVPLAQETKGWGPTGSGEAQYNFARGRVVVYLQARAAFLLQDMEVDSGPFVTYALGTIGTKVAPARLEQTLDKSVWQLTGEIGGRIRVLPGTHLLLSYAYRSYMDALLLPVEIQIPRVENQVEGGTIGLYKSHDLRIASYHAGLSFQF